jgi:hypothetical protein
MNDKGETWSSGKGDFTLELSSPSAAGRRETLHLRFAFPDQQDAANSTLGSVAALRRLGMKI